MTTQKPEYTPPEFDWSMLSVPDPMAMVRAQLEFSWMELKPRLHPLTEDHYRWEPAAGTLSVRRRDEARTTRVLGTGAWVSEWPDGPDSSVPRSIAWVISHLTECYFERWEWSFGAHKRTRIDLDLAGEVGPAVADLTSWVEAWIAGISDLDPAEVMTVGAARRPLWTRSRRSGIWSCISTGSSSTTARRSVRCRTCTSHCIQRLPPRNRVLGRAAIQLRGDRPCAPPYRTRCCRTRCRGRWTAPDGQIRMPDQQDFSGLGSASGIAHRSVSETEARAASRHWWDLDADSYVAEHGGDLGDVDLLWCPEGLRESEVQLLGPPSSLVGSRVLEIGCGTAPVARWLHRQGAAVAAIDLSAAMLGHAGLANTMTQLFPALIQADAVALPFADESFDVVVSAFGAIPFVAAPERVMAEAARVLRTGGRFVFSINHPMRWIFPDDPSVQSLSVATSYFDPNAYLEIDDAGRPTYVETHRTMSERIRDITSAGLQLVALIEPEWIAGRDVVWGQWSRERAAMIPGTAIFSCLKL